MFNPFDKLLEEITETDLKDLQTKSISEGLHIEYKSSFENPVKTSHSLASFSNSHGGYYMIGIGTDDNNIPNSFLGFSLNEFQRPKEKIRDIIKNHISPIPRFDSNLVELSNGNHILVVKIEESDEPPHITKNGKIYRRNGEGKDPIPENDRFVIDKLYDKSHKLSERIARFCNNDVTLSVNDSETGWIEIYVQTYPLNDFIFEDFFSDDFLNEVKTFLNSNETGLTEYTGNIPFDTIYNSTNSMIFRQTNNHAFNIGITYKIYVNGNCKILIPLQYVDFLHNEKYHKLRNLFSSRMSYDDFMFFKAFDGHSIMNIITMSLMKHFTLIKKYGYTNDVLILYKFKNTWRHLLIFDSDAYGEQIQNNGIPICQQSEGQYPVHIEKNTLIQKIPNSTLADYLSQFTQVAFYFGISMSTYTKSIIEWLSKTNKQN